MCVAFRAWLIACLIATEIAPSGGGVDSSQHCNSVDRVLVDFDSRQVVPGYIRFEDLLWSRAWLHLYICISTYLPIYISTYLPIYISTYLHIYLSTYLPIYLSTYLPIYLSTYLHIYLSTYLHIYLSTYYYLPFYLSPIYPPTYLPIYLSTLYYPRYLYPPYPIQTWVLSLGFYMARGLNSTQGLEPRL